MATARILQWLCGRSGCMRVKLRSAIPPESGRRTLLHHLQRPGSNLVTAVFNISFDPALEIYGAYPANGCCNSTSIVATYCNVRASGSCQGQGDSASSAYEANHGLVTNLAPCLHLPPAPLSRKSKHAWPLQN